MADWTDALPGYGLIHNLNAVGAALKTATDAHKAATDAHRASTENKATGQPDAPSSASDAMGVK